MSVPNQKKIKIQKEECNTTHKYATINLAAFDAAARDLDAGAFKLWCYFAKNQNGYEFDLSSRAAEQTFGIKIKQYNNAVKELIEKGYLEQTTGVLYSFSEIPVMTKGNNDSDSVMTKGHNGVMPKGNNVVMTKGNNALCPKDIRNNTDNTIDNTNNNTVGTSRPVRMSKSELEWRGIEYEIIEGNLARATATGVEFIIT